MEKAGSGNNTCKDSLVGESVMFKEVGRAKQIDSDERLRRRGSDPGDMVRTPIPWGL